MVWGILCDILSEGVVGSAVGVLVNGRGADWYRGFIGKTVSDDISRISSSSSASENPDNNEFDISFAV
jgi:hypothetical protein